METIEVKISTKKYAQLLQTAYQQVQLAENPKAYRITRLIYLLGILICFLLARSLPEYRQVLGIAILLMGVFLLSSSLRYNVKKRQHKKEKQPFDHMLYQITEVSSFIFKLYRF